MQEEEPSSDSNAETPSKWKSVHEFARVKGKGFNHQTTISFSAKDVSYVSVSKLNLHSLAQVLGI